MKKLFVTILALAMLFSCGVTAFAADGEADIVMDGRQYHLTLTGVEIVDGYLNVTIDGFDNALRMGPEGMILAAMPVIRDGGTKIEPIQYEANPGGSSCFLFDCAKLPDEIWLVPYDETESEVLIWEVKDISADSAELMGRKSKSALISNSVAEIENAEVGDIVNFGHYEQDNNENNGKEEIEWIVLEQKERQVLLLSRYALDCKPFHKINEEVTWENCSLRTWLNDSFMDTAFSKEEQLWICETNVKAERSEKYQQESGKDTNDKVFLLSTTELEHYFIEQSDRTCSLTTYAEANQGFCSEKSGMTCWWLRTLGEPGRAAYVDMEGYPASRGYNVAGQAIKQGEALSYVNTFTVRPALWVRLDEVSIEQYPAETDVLTPAGQLEQEQVQIGSSAEEKPDTEKKKANTPASSETDEDMDKLIWKDEDLDDEVTLRFQTEQAYDGGMHIKIYSKVDLPQPWGKKFTPVCELLIENSGSASVELPAGVYTIKIGSGTDWQGREASFGSEGVYGILHVEKASTEMSLLPGLTYTVPVDIQKAPGFFGVGVESITYTEFLESAT